MQKESQQTAQDSSEIKDIMGECDAIKTICHQIRQIAPTNCTVLVVGETGTGKSLFAQRIFELSARTEKPLIYINCATPPETKVEAEILGYHKKTLTGHSEPNLEHLAAVNGATLLIDEISELSSEAQANLLEVLELVEKINASQDKPAIDTRLIVTTQDDLRQLVQTNKFNKRLFYHLNVFTIDIPPLRERGSDKVKIAEALLDQACRKYNKPASRFTVEAINQINHYRWPGNYRELNNIIERAVLLSDSNQISVEQMNLDKEIPVAEEANQNNGGLAEPVGSENNQNLSMEDYFKHFVLEHQDQMTETELAQKLGISRKCLWERRQRLGIPKRKLAARG